MKKMMAVFACIIVSMVIILTVSSAFTKTKTSSYAEDRAQIEDLQARYLFALYNRGHILNNKY